MNHFRGNLSDHAREVEDLWSAYYRSENCRVPIDFACDEHVWLGVSGHTFREFYTNPDIHLNAQLEGKQWFCNNIIGDMAPGSPEQWEIQPQLWMEENEFFGCDVVYQEDDYAWGKPLLFKQEDLLLYLSDIDPDERVRRSHAFKMYQAMRESADGMVFDGRPVKVRPRGGSTDGIFTKAGEIRGLEQLCLDLYDSPDFVEKFLHLVTEKTIARIAAWYKIVNGCEFQPSTDGFHFCDDSIEMISADTYERFVLPCHERLYSTMTISRRLMHLCGRASQHYATLRHKLNVSEIDGPGPFVDHEQYLRDLGPGFSFSAQTDNAVLATGSEREIDSMLSRLLRPQAKIPGRFRITGFITRQTPLPNVRFCYEAAKKHGIIGRDCAH